MIDLDLGFFLVKLDRAADKTWILNGRPWMVFDSYLTIAPWKSNFFAEFGTPHKTVVLARFPGLCMELYDEYLLTKMATTLGTPFRVDDMTKNVHRGKFARVCIEIDLRLPPMVSSILTGDSWQKIAYEGLHLLCTRCKKFGHASNRCPYRPEVTERRLL